MVHKIKHILLILFIFSCVLTVKTSFASHATLPNLSLFLELSSKARQTQQNVEEKKRIRIGYKENYGVVKSPFVEGYEGYGYEYITEILKYTNTPYQVDFIPVLWTEGLKMLEEGSIDILAAANYTEERAKHFLYLQEEFCPKTLLLLSLNKHATRDFNAINGSRICVQKGDVMLPIFYDFLKEHNIQAEVIETDLGSVRKIEQSRLFDYVLSSSMQMDDNLNVVASLGTNPSFLILNKDREDLKNELDEATQRLITQDYLFKERLYLKYFDNALTQNIYISDEEYKLLRESNSYNVGIINLDSPYSYIDSNKNLQGVFVDVMHSVEKTAGVPFNLIEINKDTPRKILNSIDFCFISKKDEALFKFKRSKPIMQLPYVIVERNIELTHEKIGTLEYYNLKSEDIDFFIEAQKIQEYSSAKSLIQAFNQREIHNMIISAAVFTQHFSEIVSTNYSTRNINYWYTPTISYLPNFPDQKIVIIDKMLSHVNKFSIEDSLARHITLLTSKDELYYLFLYRYEILITLFVIFLIAYKVYRNMQRQKEKELKEIGDFNKVTGLFSPARFQRDVRKILDEQSNGDFSILSADIDNFRYINEIYGYQTGSEILKHIAYHIQQNMTEPLPVASNGDNFLILVRTPKLDSKKQSDFRLNTLNSELEKYLGKTYSISFSLGIYKIIDKSLDPTYMIDCANIARNKSKQSFGNTIEVFSEEMKNAYVEKTEVLSKVKYAFEHQEFKLFYQPKFDIHNVNIVGAEALIRWFKDEKIIPPDRFIPIIENNNLIDRLDYYVMEAACHFIQDHAHLNLPKISINISGHTIIRENVVLELIDIAQQHEVSPAKLDLEITESALVDNFGLALDNINLLRKVGFTISMDDFGAGISSLNRLHTIPIDILKIDRGFIIDALENPKGAAIIKNVINLAKDIDVETVAEGIETQEQLDFLRGLSCDVGQGYFFSKPVSEQDFLEALKKNNAK